MLVGVEGSQLCYPEAMTDIWLEWPGMAETVAKHKQAVASAMVEQNATAGGGGRARL